MASGGGFLGGVFGSIELKTGKLEQDLQKARQGMATAADEMRRLQDEFAAGTIAATTYGARMGQVANDLNAFKSQVSSAQGQLASMGPQLQRVSGDASSAGRGIMQLAYAADDLQYGFRSVVNNVPGILMGAGASQALAGALATTAVAVNVWINNWDSAKDAFGDVGPIQRATEAVKGFAGGVDLMTVAWASMKKMSPVSDAFMTKVERYYARPDEKLSKQIADQKKKDEALVKEREQAAAAVEQAHSKEDRDAGAGVAKAMDELPGGSAGVFKALVAAELKRNGAGRKGPREDELNALARGNIADQLQKAAKGDPGARKWLAGAAGDVPGLSKALADNTPEAQQQAKWEEQGLKNARKFQQEQRDKENQEKDRKAKEAEQERKQRVNRAAQDLAKGVFGANVLRGGRFTEDDVRGQLNRLHLDPSMAGEVRKEMKDRLNEQAQARAAERGISVRQARKELADEADAKRDREEEQKATKAEAEAKKLVPWAGDLGKAGLANMMAGGMGSQAAQEKMAEMLTRQFRDAGQGEKEAAMAGEKMAASLMGDLKHDAVREFLNPKRDEVRASEVFDSSQLTNKIQSSIRGPDPVTKQLMAVQSLMREMMNKQWFGRIA